VRLFVRYLSAVVELFRLRRAHLSEATRALREEHERRMGLLAEKTRLGIEKLRALAALQVPPVTRSAEKILASVLLDRLAVALLATAAIAAIVLFAPYHSWITWASLGVVAVGWVLAHRYFSSKRREWFGEKLDNDETLAERAGHLARLFPAAFVVMGHTHSPAMLPVAEGAATYVNVGSWHEAEPPADPEQAAHVYRAARTHLVIHPAPSGPKAEFLAWDGSGPRSFANGPQRDS
jgi:UDP-2,3-diacylglucosamine pyrophosphatase LpxH